MQPRQLRSVHETCHNNKNECLIKLLGVSPTRQFIADSTGDNTEENRLSSRHKNKYFYGFLHSRQQSKNQKSQPRKNPPKQANEISKNCLKKELFRPFRNKQTTRLYLHD